MRNRHALVLCIAALAIAGCGGAQAEETATTTKTCPPGQVLVSGNANGLKFSHAKQLPHGYHFEDSESGSGPDFKVTSDRNSATVNADVPLTIVCE